MKLYRILLITFFAYALISCGGAEERKAVYMEKAKASIEAGDLDKARIELKNVLQIDPKESKAYYQLGKIFEVQKEYRKAYSNYLKAEELNPDLLENQARLGRIYLLLPDKAGEAEKKIDYILTKEPNNSDGLLLKAALLLKNKKTDEAINIVKNIIAHDKKHTDSILFLATIYIKQKKLQDAISVLEAALINNKNNENINRVLAVVLTEVKDYERAEVIYKEFLERDPNNRLSYNNLATFYNRTGDKKKAEETLRAAIDNDPSDAGRILTLIKYIRETKGDDIAIKELKSFIASNEQLGTLRIALAGLYVLKGDKQSAIDVYEKAINDFSEEVTGIGARTVLISMFINDKNYDKASKILQDAIAISPNDPKVNYLRAKLAVHNKDYETAVISLRVVIKEMPENIGAYLLLASVYHQEGKDELAKRTLHNAFENNKTNTDALLQLAKFHLSRNIKQAEAIIDNYNSIKGVDYDGLLIKAAILNKNNQQDEAYEIAKKLIDLYPDRSGGYLQSMPYYSKNKDSEKAISTLEKGYLNAKDNRKLLILLTALQIKDGKFDIVEKRLKAELNVAPHDVQLNVLLAQMYLVNNKYSQAEAVLKEVVDEHPKAEEPYLLLSEIHDNKKDLKARISILIEGKNNIPSSVKIPFRLANAYELNGEYNKAINIYTDLLKNNPDNLIITNNLVSLISDYGNGKEDIEIAKSLVSGLEISGQPVFLDTAGWLYYKMGDYQKSTKVLTKAVEALPDVNIFNYHLGMSYKMTGNKDKAKHYLEKSLTSNKYFKDKIAAETALKDL